MSKYIVIKKGQESWGDLVGKEISFDWYDGYEDFPYFISGTFEGTRTMESQGPRYPQYYILVDGGGVAVSENEEVTVVIDE